MTSIFIHERGVTTIEMITYGKNGRSIDMVNQWDDNGMTNTREKTRADVDNMSTPDLSGKHNRTQPNRAQQPRKGCELHRGDRGWS